jgi:hypothetical protein
MDYRGRSLFDKLTEALKGANFKKTGIEDPRTYRRDNPPSLPKGGELTWQARKNRICCVY